MKFTQIRHGSHIIDYKGKRFLVDPVLADKGTTFALPKGRVKDKNPLLPLPFGIGFLSSIDAVLVTHMHFDHFDQAAMDLISKSMPIYCHPSEVKKISKAGFFNVTGIEDKVEIGKEFIIETVEGGKHGVGLAGMLMGRTTGYLFKDLSKEKTEPVVYLIGDSIWCDEVKQTLAISKPEVIIAFAGEARLPFGKPITMSKEDIQQLGLCASKATIVINHMDTWNHCFLTREALTKYIENKPYKERVVVPMDGEIIEFGVNK